MFQSFLLALVFTLQTNPGMELSLQIRGDTVHIGKVESAHPQISAQQFLPFEPNEPSKEPFCGPAQEGLLIYRAKYHADSKTGALLVCRYEGGLGKYMWHALD